MQFINIRTHNVNNQKQNINFLQRPKVTNIITQTTNSNPLPQEITVPVIKKMRWGEPTWFLFHTLAHKIKEEKFSQIRMEFLNIIALICNNLPCPTCSDHASAYIKRTPFYTIQTKQGLKDFFYQFHNEVNKNKKFAIFPYSELDNKYTYANTMNIIHNFAYFFQDKSRSIRMIANDMHRARVLVTLKNWFNANIQCFDI